MNGSETENLWNFTRLEKFSDRWTDAVVGEASFTFGGVARRVVSARRLVALVIGLRN